LKEANKSGKILSGSMLNKDRAARAQFLLGKLARIETLDIGRVKRIGAVDAAYKEDTGCVVYAEADFPSLGNPRFVKSFYPVRIEYVSTYLAFREAPLVIKLMLNKVRNLPDLLLVNGHGLAHPRFCGLATHLGVVLRLPTIGVSRRLIGDVESTFNRTFAVRVGRLYVSPGNMITLDQSVEIISALPLKHGYPEPLGNAHYESKKSIEEDLR
jgi:deoxyribonuclease V